MPSLSRTSCLRRARSRSETILSMLNFEYGCVVVRNPEQYAALATPRVVDARLTPESAITFIPADLAFQQLPLLLSHLNKIPLNRAVDQLRYDLSFLFRSVAYPVVMFSYPAHLSSQMQFILPQPPTPHTHTRQLTSRRKDKVPQVLPLPHPSASRFSHSRKILSISVFSCSPRLNASSLRV